ncbi:hypothetical protein [Humisphaera borealis]|uniref:Uncharacterized protein n=1 Tax=Humisphaera borealis TaxID=2807512 RepID=A0A7M2WUA8_9BACT|nr:hypothetical protein [Humisphaera borealis]QOV88381.1 hypothetical protein IPV69_19310 [Humisphaera borealis]
MSGHDPFANLYDDSEARTRAADWAFDALRQGWSPETVEAQLIANGWSADDAALFAENARKQTRHMRGVVTRSDVADAVQTSVRNRDSTLFNAGYIGPPQGFIDEPAPATAAPDKVVSYASPPDKREAKRLRAARLRAMLTILGGAGLAALGVLVGAAQLRSREVLTTRDFVLPGIMLIGGFLLAYIGYTEYRAPARLVGKIDRGLLDRPER